MQSVALCLALVLLAQDIGVKENAYTLQKLTRGSQSCFLSRVSMFCQRWSMNLPTVSSRQKPPNRPRTLAPLPSALPHH